NDILDFSKIEAGRMDLEVAPFQLRRMLEEIADSFRGRVLEKHVELIVHAAAEVPGTLLGDSLRLRQVLLNLVGNAFKFTEAGEVAVRVTLLEDTLPDDRGKDGRAKLDFSVTDTGTGIPADKVAKLGEAFTQADSSTARKYGGSGLGLAICRKLIAMMGGELVIESEESKGSRFSFAVSFSYVQSGDAATPSMPRNLKGARVLVVEDNSTNRELLGTLFAGFGMRCEMAASAEAAWSSLAAADFDLAVLDWVLPGEDGLTLAGRIRGDRRLQRLPLIMVSSFAGKEEEARAREIGIDAFIPKPITASMLFNGVLEAMKVTSAKQEDPGRQAGIEQEFAGRRLLLAEDNETNQFVANEILLGSGVELDIARNGREAVTMVADRDYDAVLMDMQMPEMDGLEATRIIRRELGGRPLPIIALTANAMQSDLEACRAAGMDDYVAKPIDRKLLFRVLRRWLAKQPVGRVAPSESIAAEIPEPASTDDSRTTARKADEIITDSSEVGSDLGGEEGSTKVSVEEPAPESIEAVEAVLSEPGTGPEPAHNPEPEIKPPAAAPDVAPPEEPDAATPADVSPRKKRARRKKDKSTSQPDLFGAVDFEEEEPGGLQVTIDADGVPVLPGVDMRDAMNRLGLPAEAVQRMVIRFAGGLKRTLGELHAAIESEDRETAQRHAHSIAGAAGNLSADSLRRVAKTLELGLKFEQGNLKAMLADVEREMARIAEGVRQLRSMIDSPEPTEETAAPPPPAELSPADVRRLRTLLEELAASLEEGDYDAIGSV
ncbi:MAG TPA: hypothetical protein DCY13_06365, partial [Verrucomicrobiales bacterium]|nr:hypothetical protein [Verrucomicrobiales bacterium]